MAFDSFTQILRRLGARYPALTQRMEEARALTRWEKAVGPAIAKHTRAIRVQDSVLWVEVDHPIWKSELHHRKRQILAILNQQRNPGQAKADEALVDLLLLDPRKDRFTAGPAED